MDNLSNFMVQSIARQMQPGDKTIIRGVPGSPKDLAYFPTYSGTHYVLSAIYEGDKVVSAYWARKPVEGLRKSVGKHLAYISSEELDELVALNLTPEEKFERAKESKFRDIEGVFVYLDKGEIISSSSVKSLPDLTKIPNLEQILNLKEPIEPIKLFRV